MPMHLNFFLKIEAAMNWVDFELNRHLGLSFVLLDFLLSLFYNNNDLQNIFVFLTALSAT